MNQNQEKTLTGFVVLDQILKNNRIPYIMLAGSCLGAVRHHGFIPWDDDIDIGIFYSDYVKLDQLLKNSLGDGYIWKDYSNDRNYPRFHGKIIYQGKGVIDVFPLISISDNVIIRRFQWCLKKITFKLYKAKLEYVHKKERRNFLAKIKVYISRITSVFISRENILKLKEWNDELYEGKNTEYCINMYSVYTLKKELIKKTWIFPIQNITFENKQFLTLNDTDHYLKNLYGIDYMIPNKYQDAAHDESFKI